ncbi:MAG: plastocyanin/azurin family copper-binding protein [Nitrososphaera sp.]|jgi:plastocyanin
MFSGLFAALPAFAEGANYAVDIVENATAAGQQAYSPSPLSINTGDSVTWINQDSLIHTASSTTTAGNPDRRFDSKIIAPHRQFTFTFTNPGIYDYFCMLHPTMSGLIIVNGDPTSAPAPAPSDNSNNTGAPGSTSDNNNESTSNTTRPPEPVPNFQIIATSLSKAKNTSFTIKNSSTGGADVSAYEFVVILPDDTTIKTVKAPRGWSGEVIDNTVDFSTDGKPLVVGAKMGFRIYSPTPITDFDWQVYGEDGDILQEGSATAKVK